MTSRSRPWILLALGLLAAPVAADAGEIETRNVAILVYPGVELLDFAGPGEVFSVARLPDAREHSFRVYTVATRKEPILSQRFVTITPGYSIDDCPPPDILVLPGGNVPLGDEQLAEWIHEVTGETEVTMSVCNGVFLLARTGRLDGLEATTHHGSLAGLALQHPEVTVFANRRFVDSGAVMTTAGVSAGIDGALHLVARLLGDEIATGTAEYMEYAWDPERIAELHAEPGRAPAGSLPKGFLTELEEHGVDPAVVAWKEQPADDRPDEDALNRAGYQLAGSHRDDQALLVFRFNVAAHPASANALDSLAELLEKLGEQDEALELTHRALALLDEGGSSVPPTGSLDVLREICTERIRRLGAAAN